MPEEEDEEPVPDKEVQLEQLQGVLSAQENEVSLHGSGRVVQQGHVLKMCCRYCKDPFYYLCNVSVAFVTSRTVRVSQLSVLHVLMLIPYVVRF